MKKTLSTISLALALSSGAAYASDATGLKGTVVETMNAGGYTYVLLDIGTDRLWFAGPQTALKSGDEVTLNETGAPMKNFHSNALNRDFDVIYFVNALATGNTSAVMPRPAASGEQQEPAFTIEPVEGGQTVADVIENKTKYSGKPIAVRGMVVKYNAQIMGKNWMHIQDGSGSPSASTHDLTVTTPNSASVGDLVVIKGALSVDKDFGHGYSYDVIVEDAEVTVEK